MIVSNRIDNDEMKNLLRYVSIRTLKLLTNSMKIFISKITFQNKFIVEYVIKT